jgi:hypothetical protein
MFDMYDFDKRIAMHGWMNLLIILGLFIYLV